MEKPYKKRWKTPACGNECLVQPQQQHKHFPILRNIMLYSSFLFLKNNEKIE